jgi:hypothetical protein
MRIIAVIEQAEVTEKILTHLGLGPSPYPSSLRRRTAPAHGRARPVACGGVRLGWPLPWPLAPPSPAPETAQIQLITFYVTLNNSFSKGKGGLQ